jgi:hypothetical protein
MPHIKHTNQTAKGLFYELNEGRIKIADAFQRGDDETGVWPASMKKDFINSFVNDFPFGMITLVHDDPSGPKSILDGANRVRCLRDFKENKFKNRDGKYYDGLTPTQKAEFENRVFQIQIVEIKRTEPKNIVAKMFTALNTRVVRLSNGELIKAMGYKEDCFCIELAKIWMKWDTHEWGEEDKEFAELQKRWELLFGELREHKRCNNLAFFTGLFLSSIHKDIKLFKQKFQVQETKLELEFDLNETDETDRIINIHTHIEEFLDIMEKIYDSSLFKAQKGVPSLPSVSIIWYLVINDMLDDEDLEEAVIEFYKQLMSNTALNFQFQGIMAKSGNNEITKSKLCRQIEFITTWYAQYN